MARLRIGYPRFPLSIHSSGRYLQTADGQPFYIHGESGWSLPVQCTRSNVDAYLNNRYAKGFTTILFMCIDHQFSSQTPAYRDPYGNDPFTTMTDFASPNEAYWKHIDYVVEAIRVRGMAAFITPAYFGFGGGNEGWTSNLNAESDADLQTYGAFLANRYRQGNIVWVMGGDYAGTVGERNKQWNIVTGMRTVHTNQIICGHPARSDGDGYTSWNGYTGWNLNTHYTDSTVDAEAITCYGRSGPLPFFNIEARYENEGDGTPLTIRRQPWQVLLLGGCGHVYGNNPVWGFGEPTACGGNGASWVIANALEDTGLSHLAVFRQFTRDYPWHTLVPKQDSSLVSSAHGSGAARVCPAMASNNRFAAIYKNDTASITVVMSGFAQSSVRGRWLDLTTGSYTAISGSPFANSGSQTISHPGNNAGGDPDWVMVFD